MYLWNIKAEGKQFAVLLVILDLVLVVVLLYAIIAVNASAGIEYRLEASRPRVQSAPLPYGSGRKQVKFHR